MELKKNPEADLEKRKSSLRWMGIMAAMALMLVSFEWKTFDEAVAGLGDYKADLVEDEIVPISFQQPPPPPPPPPQEATILDIVEDDEDVEEDLVIDDQTVDETTEIEFIEETAEDVMEEEIFTIVQDMPSFPGGDGAMLSYLGKNIKYPTLAKESGIQGTVYVTFVVEKDGAVSNVKVLRGIGGGCDEEAIRVVKSMPRWTPGKQRGKPVKVQYNLPCRFVLQG
jgi:protein TonB